MKHSAYEKVSRVLFLYVLSNQFLGGEKTYCKKYLKQTPPGEKLFVPHGKPTHLVKTEIQQFIAKHRDQARDEDSTKPMTFHGLRHTCAAEWYKQFRANGMTDREAKRRVSKLLGHEREDVTRIYLAGVKEGEKNV